MESTPKDAISRLESAVSAWSDELQSAHVDLEKRLADAANKLAEEVEGGLLDTGPILEAVEASQSRIVEVHTAVEDMIAHARDLEHRLSTLESAAQNQNAIQSTITHIADRVEHLSNQVDSDTETRRINEDIAALRSELAAIRSDDGLSELRSELQEIRDQISDAKPVDEALVLEFAKVGMEVSQLRSALKEIGINREANEPAPPVPAEEPLVVIDTDLDNNTEEQGDVLPFKEPSPAPTRSEDLTDDALRSLAYDDTGHRRRLGDILTAANAITDGQLDDALDRQSRIPTSRIGTILVELGSATELTIARVLSAQLQLPYVELIEEAISDAAVSLMNPRLARNHQCIPVSATGDTIVLAMANPLDLIAIENVELATNRRVDPVVATQSQVMQFIDLFYGPQVIVDPNADATEDE
jgi:hypothetical protein